MRPCEQFLSFIFEFASPTIHTTDAFVFSLPARIQRTESTEDGLVDTAEDEAPAADTGCVGSATGTLTTVMPLG